MFVTSNRINIDEGAPVFSILYVGLFFTEDASVFHVPLRVFLIISNYISYQKTISTTEFRSALGQILYGWNRELSTIKQFSIHARL